MHYYGYIYDRLGYTKDRKIKLPTPTYILFFIKNLNVSYNAAIVYNYFILKRNIYFSLALIFIIFFLLSWYLISKRDGIFFRWWNLCLLIKIKHTIIYRNFVFCLLVFSSIFIIFQLMRKKILSIM